ncbi:50S ribosomal protein L17 [Rhodothermaceae bacterium RA]|nr:50S ribosomal protein L17 [Rhodothermaceae bacterium RA]
MRHRNKGYKLGRTSAHRKATLAALSTALIEHKRITTTVTKAKALRMFVEPLINRAKVDSTHNRREVFRHLQNKAAVKELFGEIATQIGDRPGGYTRIVRLGQRAGDGAEMAIIELVDYNDVKPEGSAGSGRKRTRRGGGRGRRRRSGATAAPAAAATATAAPEATEDAVEAVQDAAAAEAATEAPATKAPASEQTEAAPETPAAEEVDTPAAEAPEAPEASDEETPEADDEKKDG